MKNVIGGEVFGEVISNELDKADNYGSFATGGKIKTKVFPSISIPGIGGIALPLLPSQADEIKKIAIKGQDVDRWLLQSSSVLFSCESWAKQMYELIPSIKIGLGIPKETRVSLELKQLILESGTHLLEYDLTEKPGMFGNLFVFLPSGYEGGKITIRLQAYDLSHSSRNCLYYIACHSSCANNISPITSGSRLILQYNLKCPVDFMPIVPVNAHIEGSLTILLRQATQSSTPIHYAIILNHSYEHLDYLGLGGKDLIKADILRAAFKGKGVTIRLGKLRVREENTGRKILVSRQHKLDGTKLIHPFTNWAESRVLPYGVFTEENVTRKWCKFDAIFIWEKSKYWNLKIENNFQKALAEFSELVDSKRKKNMHTIGEKFLQSYSPKNFSPLVECFVQMEDDELLKKILTLPVPKFGDNNNFKALVLSLVQAATRLGWPTIKPFLQKLLSGETSLPYAANLIHAFYSTTFPPDTAEQKLFAEIETSLKNDWKIFHQSNPGAAAAHTTQIAQLLAQVTDAVSIQRFFKSAGLLLLQTNGIAPLTKELVAPIGWDKVGPLVDTIFSEAMAEYPLKVAEALETMVLSATLAPHMKNMGSKHTTNLVELCLTKPPAPSQLLEKVFTILAKQGESELALKLLRSLQDVFSNPQLIPPLVMLGTEFGWQKLQFILSSYQKSPFVTKLQFLRLACPDPLLFSAHTKESAMQAMALSRFVQLATKHPLSAFDPAATLQYIFKMAHSCAVDSKLEKIVDNLVNKCSYYQVGALYTLLTEVWNWMQKDTKHAKSFKWFVDLHNAVLTNATKQHEELTPIVNWNLEISGFCTCFDCICFVKFCNHPSEVEYCFSAHEKKRTHLEDLIKINKLAIRTETMTNGKPHTLVCTKKPSENKERLDWLQKIMLELNRMIPKNTHPLNDTSTQANKKPRV